MAARDKIYGTIEQWNELFIWLAENRPQYCKFLYTNQGKSKEIAISNFPSYADKWLLKNCPFEWVKEKIKEQYNIK